MSSVYTANYSYDYYLRSIYSKNRDARKAETRTSLDNTTLMSADSSAMQKIAKQLRELEYDSDHGTDIYNGVSLYVETYNNLLDSASASDSTAINGLKKQIIQLTKEDKDRLESIGITITSNGRLKLDKTTFVTAEPSKIARIFSSKNALTESIQAYSKKIGKEAHKLSFYTENAQKSTIAPSSSGSTVDISL